FEGEEVNYWDEEELQAWKEKDPISRLGDSLIEGGLVEESDLNQIQQEVADEIEAAVEFAESSEMPDPEDALNDVFTERIAG
ncbi:MAG: thiamine pyrophosphate-dependent enzyme, partial [Anaerolineales bacterium]